MILISTTEKTSKRGKGERVSGSQPSGFVEELSMAVTVVLTTWAVAAALGVDGGSLR